MVVAIDDSFQRANTSVGGANSTTGVGNGWVDGAGSTYRIVSDQLVGQNSGAGFATYWLYRQLSERYQDQLCIVDWVTSSTGANNGQVAPVCRLAGGAFYMAFTNPANNSVGIYSVAIGGAATLITSASLTIVPGRTYEISLSAVGINPTRLGCSVVDTSTGTVIAYCGANDSTAALQTNQGICAITINGSQTAVFSRLRTLNLDTSVIPVTDSNLYISANSLNTGTLAQFVNSGATTKLTWSGTSLNVMIDTYPLDSNAIAPANYPEVMWSVDNGALTGYIQLRPYQMAYNVANGITSGTHTFEFFVVANGLNERWNGPVDACFLRGFNCDGASVPPTNLLPKRLQYYADSIGEGTRVLGLNFNIDDHDVRFSPAFALQFARNAEISNSSYGGQGWTISSGTVPAFSSTWNMYDANHSRLVNGLMSPMPDEIAICQGENDFLSGANPTTVQSTIVSTLTAMRTAAPNALIWLIVPTGGAMRSAITAAFTTLNATDKKLYLIDRGTAVQTGLTGSALNLAGTRNSADTVHPYGFYNMQTEAYTASLMQLALVKTGGSFGFSS